MCSPWHALHAYQISSSSVKPLIFHEFLTISRGRCGAIWPRPLAKPQKYKIFHRDWFLCKVWWVFGNVKALKIAIYLHNNNNNNNSLNYNRSSHRFGARALIKAASGVERALAPPRPSGGVAVGEEARRCSKYHVQHKKFVKRTVQLHWEAYFLVPVGGAMSVSENGHTDAFRLAPLWNV